MTGVTGLFLWLLVAASLVYLLHRGGRLAGLLLCMLTLPLFWLAINMVDDQHLIIGRWTVVLAAPTHLLGVTYQLMPAAQVFLAFLSALLLLFAILYMLLGGHSAWPALAILLLVPLSGLAMVRQFAFQPWWFAIAAVIAAVMIQNGRLGSTITAQRTLLFPILAVPFLFVLPQLLDKAALNPVHQQPLHTAYWLVTIVLFLLSGAFPFHGALVMQDEDDAPLNIAFWWLVSEAAWLFMFQRAATLWPAWFQSAHMDTLLLWGGLLTIGWAGFAGLFSRDLGRLWSYAALAEWGSLLLLLSRNGTLTLALLWLFVGRAISLSSSGALLTILSRQRHALTLEKLHGWARLFPFTAAMLILSLLSLLGAPLTAGFGPHWAVYQTLSTYQTSWGLLFLLATFAITIGILRSVVVLAATLPSSEGRAIPWPNESRWNVLLALLVMVGIIAGFIYAAQFGPWLRYALASLLTG